VIGESTHDLTYRCHLGIVGPNTFVSSPLDFLLGQQLSLVLSEISSTGYICSLIIPYPECNAIYPTIATARWGLVGGVSELEVIPMRSCLPLSDLITNHTDHNGILYSRKLRVLPKNLSPFRVELHTE
jgi:hypothetical protein